MLFIESTETHKIHGNRLTYVCYKQLSFIHFVFEIIIVDGYSVQQHVYIIIFPSDIVQLVPFKFVSTSLVNDRPISKCRRTKISAKNILIFKGDQKNPRQLISSRLKELGHQQTTTWRIFCRSSEVQQVVCWLIRRRVTAQH